MFCRDILNIKVFQSFFVKYDYSTTKESNEWQIIKLESYYHICMSEHDWNIAVVEGSLKRTLHIGTSVNID